MIRMTSTRPQQLTEIDPVDQETNRPRDRDNAHNFALSDVDLKRVQAQWWPISGLIYIQTRTWKR